MVSNITEGAKRKTPSTQAAIEPDFLYPLVRSRDLRKWKADVQTSIIVPQDPNRPAYAFPEKLMCDGFPKTFAYLTRFKDLLARRKSQVIRNLADAQAFYFLYSVKDYTMSSWKVIWQRMGDHIQAAVCGKLAGRPVIPQETLCFVGVEGKAEAHYICAAMNSAPFDFAVRSYSQKGGKSFASPHILQNLRVPPFSPKNPVHAKLSSLSEQAHKSAGSRDEEEMLQIENEIDSIAAKLWNLTQDELAEIQQSLEEM